MNAAGSITNARPPVFVANSPRQAASGSAATQAEAKDSVELGAGRESSPKPAAAAAPPAAEKAEAAPRPAAQSAPTVLFQAHEYTPMPDRLAHIATTTLDASEVATPEGRQAVANEMAQQLTAWPSLKAVVAVAPNGDQTSVVVASRENAVNEPKLEGIYEVNQRLGSSQFIKDHASAYPCQYYGVTQFDAAGKTHEIKLPGSLSTEQVEGALFEGRERNQYGMLKDLVESLPKDTRVALLIGGPSAAGKSTLIRKIEEYAGDRKVSVVQGDMYFKDVDDPAGFPLTEKGTPYWDHENFMDLDRLNSDLTDLITTGEADIPVYNFQDERPGGWRVPTPYTGFREEKPTHVTSGGNDILVLDSIHATNPQVVAHFEKLGLPYKSVYLDSPNAEDRLLRRIVRDYEQRGGRAVDASLEIWDQTTYRGEREFIRPGILRLDASRDAFLVLQFPNDLGLTREQIDAREAVLEEYGVSPSYEAFGTPEADLPAFAKAEEQRLEGIVNSDADDKARAKASRELEQLRSAPRYQAA